MLLPYRQIAEQNFQFCLSFFYYVTIPLKAVTFHEFSVDCAKFLLSYLSIFMYVLTQDKNIIVSEKYVEKLFGINRDRMSVDQMAVLLASNVNESKSHSK